MATPRITGTGVRSIIECPRSPTSHGEDRPMSPGVHDTVCKATWSFGRLLRQITHFARPNHLQEPGMAQNKKATKEVDEVLPYLEGVAKSLVDRLYGPAGPAWGTKFSELEETVATI